ncbi:sugar transferase [Azohydromonas caseinilytica]|uniref:sugar transferase n=1 Tax=Azohydromonas caseinilytica TaxID=2728836 RepID=UPI001F413E53|nr:sugar transferase [Azohydromonas caseinilytica]
MIHITPGGLGVHTASFVAGLPVAFGPRDEPYRAVAWKVFNQVVAALLLLLFSPLMAVIAICIWRVDGAPIVFAHYRVGMGGKVFPCLKFRSMVRNSEQVLQELLRSDPAARDEWIREQKLSNDPRITPIGRILRKLSLDELPQLFNVLRGEMNLVGPRPIMLCELPRYGQVRWHYLSVKPGMTGLWQVSGRNSTSYEERVELDRNYVEKRSEWLDICILFRTLGVVISGHGAQ